MDLVPETDLVGFFLSFLGKVGMKRIIFSSFSILHAAG